MKLTVIISKIENNKYAVKKISTVECIGYTAEINKTGLTVEYYDDSSTTVLIDNLSAKEYHVNIEIIGTDPMIRDDYSVGVEIEPEPVEEPKPKKVWWKR